MTIKMFDEALNRTSPTSPSDLSVAIALQTEFDTLYTKNSFSSVKEYPRQGSTSSSEKENPQKKNPRKILQPSTEQNTDEALNRTSPSALSMAEFGTLSTKSTFSSEKEYPREGSTFSSEEENPQKKNLRKILQPSTEQNTDEALNHTEFDTLSTTSSVEYFYSEEEYPRQVDYSDDEEEDTTPTEHNIDEALNCTSFSALSCMVSNWFDDWPVSDEHLEKLMKSCEDSVAGRGEAFTWIHVYAYFNKKQGYGGYGVLVHNELGVPITASARFSKDGCSFYHQVFEGINAGATLAGKLGRSHFRIWCNSARLPSHFSYLVVCDNRKCKDTANADNICDRCDEYIMSELGCCPTMKLLVLKLRQKDPIEFFYNPAGVAVHYLAKLGKKKEGMPNWEKRRKEGMPPMKVRLNMRFN